MTAQINPMSQNNNSSTAQNPAAQELPGLVPYYEPLITMMITPWVMWSNMILTALQSPSRFRSPQQQQFSDDIQAARDRIIEHAAVEVMGQGQGYNGGGRQQQQYPPRVLQNRNEQPSVHVQKP